MLARSTESVLVEPESVVEPTINSTNIRFRTLKPPNVNKMEFLENTGLDTKEWEKDKSDATTSEEKTNVHVYWKRRRLIAKEALIATTRPCKSSSSTLW